MKWSRYSRRGINHDVILGHPFSQSPPSEEYVRDTHDIVVALFTYHISLPLPGHQHIYPAKKQPESGEHGRKWFLNIVAYP